MLKIFAVKDASARQARCVNDHRIPGGNSIQPMRLNGRDNIVLHKANDSGTLKHLHLLLRRFRINPQFPGCSRKVLLKDLKGNNQQTGSLIVGDDLNRAPAWPAPKRRRRR